MMAFSNYERRFAVAKLKVKFDTSQIMVKSKLDIDENFNSREINILNSKIIRGIMTPTVIEEKRISYLSPSGIRLNEYLKTGLSRNDFFLVIAQILEVEKSVCKNSFNINNLVLDTKNIFINERTKELHFIYQPILSNKTFSDLSGLLLDVAYGTTLNLNENYDTINYFINFLKSLPVVSIIKVEEYVLNVCPEIYKQIKRQKFAQSEYLDVKPKDLFYPQSATKPESQVTPPAIGYDIPTTTLLINDSGNQTILLEKQKNKTLIHAFLIRKNNGEKININKPVFRIGKERSYVDYFVANNSTVSRLHADIITKNNHCFICDNNSTNKTRINGNIIPSGQEIELKTGDLITLSNEEFEFYIN